MKYSLKQNNMLIKEAVYKKVTVEQNQLIEDEVFGCDHCKKEIKEFPNEESRLVVDVFRHNDNNTEHLHFCSWKCVLSHLPKIKTDYFLNLPFVSFDSTTPGRSAKDLFKLLKKISSPRK